MNVNNGGLLTSCPAIGQNPDTHTTSQIGITTMFVDSFNHCSRQIWDIPGFNRSSRQRRHQQEFEENNFLLFQNLHEGHRNLLFWPQYEESISCGEIRVLKGQQDHSRVKLRLETSFVKLGSILVISESQENSSSVPCSSFSNAFLQLHFSNVVIAGFYSTFQD